MLTPKQSPAALIGIFAALGLAEGEPERGKMIIALVFVALTVLYVLMCNRINQRENE